MLIPSHWASYPGGPADLPRGLRIEIKASDRFLVSLDRSLLKACHESCLTAFSRSESSSLGLALISLTPGKCK